MVPLSQSPLFQAIQKAILQQQNSKAGIRISITSAPRKLHNASSGEVGWMKALCWNLLDEQGGYLTDPVLAVVRRTLTEKALEARLHALFPGRKVIVDNDIYVDDET